MKLPERNLDSPLRGAIAVDAMVLTWRTRADVRRTASCLVEVCHLLASHVHWRSGGRILSLALLGGITIVPLTGAIDGTPQVAAPPQYSVTAAHASFPCSTTGGALPSLAPTTQPQTLQTALTPSSADGRVLASRPVGATLVDTLVSSSALASVNCATAWSVDARGRLSTTATLAASDDDGALLSAQQRDFKLAMKDSATFLSTASSVEVHKAVAKPKPTPAPRPAPVITPAPAPNPNPGGTGTPPGGISPWAPVPGHPSYAMGDYAGDPWSGYFGVCTWYAAYRHQDEPLMRLGNAASWAYTASGYGLRVGSAPAVGATAVFQPGVEGAGGGGHVAHVEAVLGGGWFIVSEMNFYVNGGGFGRVDWRYAYAAPGVSFIY